MLFLKSFKIKYKKLKTILFLGFIFLFKIFNKKKNKEDKQKKTNSLFKSKKLFFPLIFILIFILGVSFISVYGFFGSGQTDSTPNLQKGLVGHWALNESNYNPSNQRVADSTPYDNHGTNYGATFTSDRFGKEGGAMEFTINDYLDTANNVLEEQEMTMSLWIKPLSTDSTQRVVRTLGANTNRYYIIYSPFSILVVRGQNIGRNVSVNTSIGQWRHITVYWKSDGYILRIYIDGELKYNGTYDGVVSGGDATLGIARQSGSEVGFEGLIDDIRIYNRALSSEEISLLYDSYKPQLQVSSLDSGLIGHWSLNEIHYNPSTSRVSDLTPYSNHATNYGATFTTDRFGNEGGAMSFNGSSNYININNYSNYNNEMSMSAWFKFLGENSTGRFAIVSMNRQFFEIRSDPSWRIRFWPNHGAGTSKSWTPNSEWNHIVGTIKKTSDDTTNLNVYLNGELWDESSRGIFDLNNTNKEIGSRDSGSFFNGQIDDVRIYNRILSEQEIGQLYNSYKPKLSISSEPLLSMNCNPPTTGRWTINDKVVCVGETITVDELVLINDGGELHLHNVTFNMDHPSTSQDVLRVYNGAKLYSNDTLFTSNLSGTRAQYIRNYFGGESYFNNTTLIGAPAYIRFRNYGYTEISNSDFNYVNYFYDKSETHIKDSHIRNPYLYIQSGHEMEVDGLDYTNTNLTYNFISNNDFRLNSVNSHLRNLALRNTTGKLTINNSNLYALFHYNYNSNQGTFINNSSIYVQFYYAYQSGHTVDVENIHEPLSSFTGKIAETSNDKNIHFDNSNITRLYYYSAYGTFNMKDSTVWRFYGTTDSQNELDNVAISYRMFLLSNSINTIKNSNFNASNRIYLYNTSQTTLINSSLDSPNFRLYNTASLNSDTNSTLTRLRLTSGNPSISGYTNIDNFNSWSSGVVLNRELPFKVLNTSMNPVSGATVAIYDGGTLLDSATSNSLGKVNLSISADNSANQGKTYEVRVNGQVADNVTILESSGSDGIELIGSW